MRIYPKDVFEVKPDKQDEVEHLWRQRTFALLGIEECNVEFCGDKDIAQKELLELVPYLEDSKVLFETNYGTFFFWEIEDGQLYHIPAHIEEEERELVE